MTSWPQFVPHALPLMKPLAKRALVDSGVEEGGKCDAVVVSTVLFCLDHRGLCNLKADVCTWLPYLWSLMCGHPPPNGGEGDNSGRHLSKPSWHSSGKVATAN